MSDPCAPEWADTIELCLGGDGSPSDWDRLRAHQAACPACKAWYDEQARLTGLLAGEPDGLAPAAMAAGEARLLAALGVAEVEAPTQPAKVLRFPTRRVLAGAGLLLAAAAALALWVTRAPEPTFALRELPGFQARGDDDGAPKHGFQVFCVDTGGDAPRIRATAVSDGPEVRCRLGDRIQIKWSAPTDAPVYLGLMRADAEHRDVLRAPTAAPPGIIKRTWLLDRAGQTTIVGVFADRAPQQPLPAVVDAKDAGWPKHTARILVEAPE